MKTLVLDVLGVLVARDSLLDYKEFFDICHSLKNNGKKILVFSNSTSGILHDEKLREFTDKYVDSVYFADQGLPLKPSVESFQALLDIHDLVSDECVYIDDSQRNIEIGKSLGFDTILFTDSNEVIKKLITATLSLRGGTTKQSRV